MKMIWRCGAGIAALLLCISAHADVTTAMNTAWEEAFKEVEAGRITTWKGHAQEAYLRVQRKATLPDFLHRYYENWISEAAKVDAGAQSHDDMWRAVDLELMRLVRMQRAAIENDRRRSEADRRQAMQREADFWARALRNYAEAIRPPPTVTCQTTRYGSGSTTTCN